MNEASLDHARAIVDTVKYLTLATVDTRGDPWNAPVFGMCDDAFNCYWGSYVGTQHSKNIELNGKVYIAIYDSTVAPGTGWGVYIRGVASKIEDLGEIERVYDLMKERHDDHFWPIEVLSGEGPIRFYKATKEHLWMNDGGELDGVYTDVRKELA